jgi:hypothetical protein
MSDSPQIERNCSLVKRFVDEWLDEHSRDTAGIAHRFDRFGRRL